MLIVDANFRASQLFRAAGYDVLDIAFYLRNHALYAYRVKDGVHWDSVGTRIMTQLVIGHLARSWGIPVPQRIRQKLTNL
ncbi:hypothetical protein ANCDUO_06540 [Ancylostoma duodenale]|uniref:AlgX/AlgJ SGNH hydrolase-like domain-containing protein n=1 Tax=Ancylostoma duodenale TaxID=51022 RepID=A0A0C2GP89_9BILA|nr:hypothetical protein ANCDUO_06540 [Ancylostoma duodenale]